MHTGLLVQRHTGSHVQRNTSSKVQRHTGSQVQRHTGSQVERHNFCLLFLFLVVIFLLDKISTKHQAIRHVDFTSVSAKTPTSHDFI